MVYPRGRLLLHRLSKYIHKVENNKKTYCIILVACKRTGVFFMRRVRKVFIFLKTVVFTVREKDNKRL